MGTFTEQFRQGAEQAIESLSEGWRELKAKASGALTRFRSEEARDGEGDAGTLASFGRWAYLAADVHEEDDRIVVRLEAPGMRKDDFDVEVRGTTLQVRGEKRVDRETRRGGYHVVQCAYGSFRRDVPLPVDVQADQARATYRDGVLRVELPKAEGARRTRISIDVG